MVSYRLSIRKMERNDIPYLVDWATARSHVKGMQNYLPRTAAEANSWFQRSLLDKSRDDYMIYVTEETGDKYPIGILGLVNIDDTNRKGEYYVVIGNDEFLRRGIAFRTSNEMIQNTYFKGQDFAKIYTRVDKDNFAAQKLVEKLGFRKEGLMLSDGLTPAGAPIDRIYYGLLPEKN